MNWSWAGPLVLGVFHGVNPGMGWLFAVALGLQDRRRAAVCRAMVPLAVGHALAVAAVVMVAVLAGAVVPVNAIRMAVAAVLLLLGVSRVFRHGHPRWVGMQVGLKDLTLWSFLMASAHGAGLMVLPFVLGAGAVPHHGGHTAAAGAASAVWATIIHSAGYLGVSALIALLVFEKLGLQLLRRAWFNLDLVWAAALVVTGVMALTMG